MAIDTNPEEQLVYPVARQFVERALDAGDSLFTPGRPVWGKAALDELWKRFVEQPDTGDDPFLVKLQRQLDGAAHDTIQLAAEALCVYFLVPHQTKRETKLAQIGEVLSWMADPPAIPADVQAAMGGGIVGSAGTAWGTRRPFLLWFLLDVARHLRKLPAAERHELLLERAGAWKLRKLLHDGVEDRGSASMREALLHLVHPETFENITSQATKQRIADGLSQYLPAERPVDDNVDRQLLDLRERLSKDVDGRFDFFDPAWRKIWDSTTPEQPLPLPKSTWLLPWNAAPRSWPSDPIPDLLAELASGAEVVVDWPVGRGHGIERGDRVYLVTTGGEAPGFFASGRCLGPAKSKKAATIRLDELIDPTTTRTLAREALPQAIAGVPWPPGTSPAKLPAPTLAAVELAWQRHLADIGAASLRVVTSIDQLRESLQSYSQALDGRLPEARFAVAHVEIWVAGSAGQLVAPSKWAGFRGMTPVTYAALQKLQAGGGRPRGFGGQRARAAVRAVGRRAFTPNEQRTIALRERFAKAFGTEAIAGVSFSPLQWLDVDTASDPPPPHEGPVGAQNIILYGPPGTGKTYATAQRAVELCEGTAPADREELMTRYRALTATGRIQMVTFHQSFGYEDFVEGIRPVIERTDGTPTTVGYHLHDGVFKRLCDAAATQVERGAPAPDVDFDVTFWKISLGQADAPEDAEIFEEAMDKGIISMGWGDPIDFSGCDDATAIKQKLEQEGRADDARSTAFTWASVQRFKNAMAVGDLVIASHGTRRFRAIGRVTGHYRYVERERYCQTRPVEWLVKLDLPQPIDLISSTQLSQAALYRIAPGSLNLVALRELLQPAGPNRGPQPHVLIIDEINRGNVSKIFGELITLLEPDKRIGEVNELRSRLPYSAVPFGVPANLHVIGTMNSADRSIALLDTALRRRFRFEEVRPDPAVIRELVGNRGVVDGVDVARLLQVMNDRIELLLGRDHALGHAFFLDVESLGDLCNVFRNSVLPLLREYFYENDERICRVLGCRHDEHGKSRNPNPILAGHLLDPGALLGDEHGRDSKVVCEVHPDFRPDGPNLRDFFAGVLSAGQGSD